jgi:uncharacterized protein YcbX
VNFGTDLKARKCKESENSFNLARDKDEAIFHDLSPFMLISEESLNDINSKLTEKVTIRNFRPNFFVQNCSKFAEDDWDEFWIEKVNFFKIRHCTRCL